MDLLEKRLNFIRENYLVGNDEERLYRQNESSLKPFTAIAGFGVKDPNESITLLDKYQGWILPLNRIGYCSIIVVDTVLWMHERENRPIYDEIDGVRLSTIRDDVRAAIKKAFHAMIDAAQKTTESTVEWTIPELLNVDFRRLKHA